MIDPTNMGKPLSYDEGNRIEKFIACELGKALAGIVEGCPDIGDDLTDHERLNIAWAAVERLMCDIGGQLDAYGGDPNGAPDIRKYIVAELKKKALERITEGCPDIDHERLKVVGVDFRFGAYGGDLNVAPDIRKYIADALGKALAGIVEGCPDIGDDLTDHERLNIAWAGVLGLMCDIGRQLDAYGGDLNETAGPVRVLFANK